jgi:hypothetical protein
MESRRWVSTNSDRLSKRNSPISRRTALTGLSDKVATSHVTNILLTHKIFLHILEHGITITDKETMMIRQLR